MPSYKAGLADNVLPEGEYEYTVESCRLKTATETKNQMFELRLGLPFDGIAFDNLVFTPSAYWKIDQFRESIGETVTPGEELDLNASDFIGATGRALFKIEHYEGKDRNRVEAYLPADVPRTATSAVDKPADDIPY